MSIAVTICFLLLIHPVHSAYEDYPNYEYQNIFTYGDLKVYLTDFETRVKDKIDADLDTIEYRVNEQLNTESRQMEQRLKKDMRTRLDSWMTSSLEERVNDLIQSGSLSKYIDNAIVEKVNRLERGLTLLEGHVKGNIIEISKFRGRLLATDNKVRRVLRGSSVSRNNGGDLERVRAEMGRMRTIVNRTSTDTEDIKSALSILSFNMSKASANVTANRESLNWLKLEWHILKTSVDGAQTGVRKLRSQVANVSRVNDVTVANVTAHRQLIQKMDSEIMALKENSNSSSGEGRDALDLSTAILNSTGIVLDVTANSKNIDSLKSDLTSK